MKRYRVTAREAEAKIRALQKMLSSMQARLKEQEDYANSAANMSNTDDVITTGMDINATSGDRSAK